MPSYWGGPFRVRTFLRSNLPWCIIDTGVVDKGEDCEAADGQHEWYNVDDKMSACYHCSVQKDGHLWKET